MFLKSCFHSVLILLKKISKLSFLSVSDFLSYTMSVNRLIQECFAVNTADSIRNLVLNYIAKDSVGGDGKVML